MTGWPSWRGAPRADAVGVRRCTVRTRLASPHNYPRAMIGRRQAVAPSPWRVVFWIVGVTFGVVVIVGAFAAVSLFRIASDLNRARSMIETASTDIRQG